jgi:hypothetical protein
MLSRMETAPDLPRQSRAFIVLVALLQGALLYLAQRGADAGWWPFAALGGRVCWYTLVLTVPTLTLLSVRRLSEWRLWQHLIALALLVAALSAWAAWSATGAPGLRSANVLVPFGMAIALGMFVLLPWLQCRLQHGHWLAPYRELFEHAWQNALTLALAWLFVGICWLVLWLWGALFALVKLEFFRALFRQSAFVYLATGSMFGLGLLIGRTQQRAVQVMRQILFAICTGLLPLLAFVAVLFALSLPFTGLQPLWETRAAAKILIALVAALVLFVNAVYQDGSATAPYPQWLRRLIDAGLLSLSLYALLALYALWLRIDQYGWSAERFSGVLVAVVACGYAFGYAWAVLRPDGRWLRPLAPVNRVMSWVVIAHWRWPAVRRCWTPTASWSATSCNASPTAAPRPRTWICPICASTAAAAVTRPRSRCATRRASPRTRRNANGCNASCNARSAGAATATPAASSARRTASPLQPNCASTSRSPPAAPIPAMAGGRPCSPAPCTTAAVANARTTACCWCAIWTATAATRRCCATTATPSAWHAGSMRAARTAGRTWRACISRPAPPIARMRRSTRCAPASWDWCHGVGRT